MYTNWTLFIAPIVLRGRFPHKKFYDHFIVLINLLKLCLAYEITDEMLDEIEKGFQKWVQQYEELYYENDPDRLSACPLTVHALLHIADSIRENGPVWVSWAFPMERHCGILLRAIRSRRHPYVSLSAFVAAKAQLKQIRLKYDLTEVLRLDRKRINNNKTIYPMYPMYQFSIPTEQTILPKPLRRRIWAALATQFDVDRRVVKAIVKLDQPVVQHGRVVRLDRGDLIRASDMVKDAEDSRDASYVRYTLLVDIYARQKQRKPKFVYEEYFGQLKRTFAITIPCSKRLGVKTPTTVVLALMQELKVYLRTNGLYYYKRRGGEELVDMNTVKCVVGRIPCANGEWAVVDRSDLAGVHVD
ncbi:hypothetical protein BJ165DRAFT_1512670 [Panaeolus papilionaceus]|nr:hypothetical protein BJ165DRAFT_1512670 [Panaeolus papilionaceus]